jgi:hypothetical protein
LGRDFQYLDPPGAWIFEDVDAHADRKTTSEIDRKTLTIDTNFSLMNSEYLIIALSNPCTLKNLFPFSAFKG